MIHDTPNSIHYFLNNLLASVLHTVITKHKQQYFRIKTDASIQRPMCQFQVHSFMPFQPFTSISPCSSLQQHTHWIKDIYKDHSTRRSLQLVWLKCEENQDKLLIMFININQKSRFVSTFKRFDRTKIHAVHLRHDFCIICKHST